MSGGEHRLEGQFGVDGRRRGRSSELGKGNNMSQGAFFRSASGIEDPSEGKAGGEGKDRGSEELQSENTRAESQPRRWLDIEPRVYPELLSSKRK